MPEVNAILRNRALNEELKLIFKPLQNGTVIFEVEDTVAFFQVHASEQDIKLLHSKLTTMIASF